MRLNGFILFLAMHLVLSVSMVRSRKDESEPKLDLEIDHSKYIDPHDMFNYDPKSIHRPNRGNQREDSLDLLPKPISHNKNDETTENILSNEVADFVDSIKSLPLLQSKQIKDIQSESNIIAHQTNTEMPFLLRFLRILSDLLSLKDQSLMNEEDDIKVPLTATVTKHYKFVIEEILRSGNHIPQKRLAELDEVLSNMFTLDEGRHMEGERFYLQRMIQLVNLHAKDWLVVMHLICVMHALILALSGHSIRSVILKSIMPIMIVSWYWHWQHLDEKATAKRHSEMAKASQPPAACNPDALDTWSTLKLVVSTTVFGYADPCDEYHRALLTDPTYEISPFLALVDMLATGIFHPLKYIGEQFGGFFDGVLSSTGFFTKTPVFLAVLVIILFLFLLLCGYEFHTPLLKITNTKAAAAAAAQVQNVVHAQALLENAAAQALERHVRESRILERGAVLHPPKVEPVILRPEAVEASTQSDDFLPLPSLQAIEPRISTSRAVEEALPRSCEATLHTKGREKQEATMERLNKEDELQAQQVTNTSPKSLRKEVEPVASQQETVTAHTSTKEEVVEIGTLPLRALEDEPNS